jgi:hypothetical protein
MCILINFAHAIIPSTIQTIKGPGHVSFYKKMPPIISFKYWYCSLSIFISQFIYFIIINFSLWLYIPWEGALSQNIVPNIMLCTWKAFNENWKTRCWWLMPVILDTWESEIRRISLRPAHAKKKKKKKWDPNTPHKKASMKLWIHPVSPKINKNKCWINK